MAGQTVSPMMQQYFEIKRQHPNEILFYRVGDFYEMFYDDALTASRELELTLTGKACGGEERAPMCGVPFHSYEIYVARLIAKGYKVAICEQMEDPALAKGLVKRDIIRVVTPGTVIESSMLKEDKNNYLCSICAKRVRRSWKAGVCFADISTGEAWATELSSDKMGGALIAELCRFAPSDGRYRDLWGRCYRADLGPRVREPIEHDHVRRWIPAEHCEHTLFLDYQAWAVRLAWEERMQEK